MQLPDKSPALDKNTRLERISELIFELARGNFNFKVPVTTHEDELEAIVHGIEMLGEELKASTVSRNYLDSVLKGIVDLLFIVDVNGNILSVNDAGINQLGLQPDSISGKPFAGLLSDSSRAAWNSFFSKLIHDSAPTNFELEFQTHSFGSFPVVCSLSALAGTSRWQALLIAKDISAQKQVQAESKEIRRASCRERA